MNEAQKRVTKAMELALTTTIQQAIDDLIDRECPHCYRPIEQPSLDSIQYWLGLELEDNDKER